MARRVDTSVVVEDAIERVYDYWSTLENLPRFMTNVEEVRPVGPGRTHWRIKGPLGAGIEFDAETTSDEEAREISWCSVEGDVETSGHVSFREVGAGHTRVEVSMWYWDLPGGRLGEAGSRFVANPQLMVDQDLRNFKDIMEGLATPEEIQQRISGATAQSGMVVFLTSGAGLLVVGGALLLLLLLRRSKKRRST